MTQDLFEWICKWASNLWIWIPKQLAMTGLQLKLCKYVEWPFLFFHVFINDVKQRRDTSNTERSQCCEYQNTSHNWTHTTKAFNYFPFSPSFAILLLLSSYFINIYLISNLFVLLLKLLTALMVIVHHIQLRIVLVGTKLRVDINIDFGQTCITILNFNAYSLISLYVLFLKNL